MPSAGRAAETHPAGGRRGGEFKARPERSTKDAPPAEPALGMLEGNSGYAIIPARAAENRAAWALVGNTLTPASRNAAS